MGKTLGSERHKTLVKLLIAKRERANMTQADLAERLGEYQSFVARLESGQRRIDVIEFLRLAEVMAFDPARVLKTIATFS